MLERYWAWNYEIKDLGLWPGEGYKGHNMPVEVVKAEDAQATIADLQGQVKASQAERDEQGQLKARLNRDYNLLQNEHLKLHEKVKQEAAYTKQVEIERDALQQRVAQLEGELAAAKAPRVYDCGSCAIGIGLAQRVAQLEKERDIARRRVDELEAREIDTTILQADHARVLGLVQALPVAGLPVEHARSDDFVVLQANGEWMVHTYNYWAKFATEEEARAYIALLEYRASLPAQRAKLAQGGAKCVWVDDEGGI